MATQLSVESICCSWGLLSKRKKNSIMMSPTPRGTCLHPQVKTFAGRREKGVSPLFSHVRENEGILLNQPLQADFGKQAVFPQPPAFQAGGTAIAHGG
jgi:hypothetical protein